VRRLDPVGRVGVIAPPWIPLPPGGVTGYIRPGVDGLAEAAGLLSHLDRDACRAHVAERFSGEAMADAHER
jgi:hypothetical protein